MKSKQNLSTLNNHLYSLTQALFDKQPSTTRILGRLAQISNDPSHKQPVCILFSLYNFIFINNIKMAYLTIEKAQQQQNNNAGTIIELTLKSVLLAQMKQHKQSLSALNKAFDLLLKEQMGQNFISSYRFILLKLIEIQDMSTFKRQYMTFMDRIFDKFNHQSNQSAVLKAIQLRYAELKKKVCGTTSRTKLISLNSKPKSIITVKDSEKASMRSGVTPKDKSASRSRLYSPRSKLSRNFKKNKYINPYNLQNLIPPDNCVFM